MKKLLLPLLMIFPGFLFAQIGLKAGVNFANVTNASSINSNSRSGFHAGLFLAPGGNTKIFGFRTELLYSKQGYDYKTSSNTGNVNLDYILLPQMTTISITKYFQIQLGAQMAFLLNAKVDSSNKTTTGNATADKIMDYYNRFDYGFAGGIEIHPVSGLLIGARLNISLGNMYKDIGTTSPGTQPSFIPKVDVKNNVFQVFAGWTFGNKSSKKK
jgi:hypothetical protein